MRTNRQWHLKIVNGKDSWKRVAQKWAACLASYGNEFDWADVPWRYKERAQVGFLAAAAWASGGIALEEYATKKVRGHGRCDLFMRTDGRGYLVEAKFNWVTLSSVASSMKRLCRDLDRACADASKLTEDEQAVGAVFATLACRRSKWREIEKHVVRFLKALKLEFGAKRTAKPKPGSDCYMVACFFGPSANKAIQLAKRRSDEWAYLGCALLLRPVERTHRE